RVDARVPVTPDPGEDPMVDVTASLQPRDIEQLRRACPDVVTPDHGAYDESRRLWNAIHDRRPAAIARPASAQEVAAAVAFAREDHLEIAGPSGGHPPA